MDVISCAPDCHSPEHVSVSLSTIRIGSSESVFLRGTTVLCVEYCQSSVCSFPGLPTWFNIITIGLHGSTLSQWMVDCRLNDVR